MNWTLRITRHLVETIRRDLARRHLFAAERVGFLLTKLGNRDNPYEKVVLAADYEPIPDEDYIDDPTVGARYAAAVHRRLFERAIADQVGVFHVHEHAHRGTPAFSGVDLSCIRKLIPSLRGVCPAEAHGGLLFSVNAAHCLCWLPGLPEAAPNGRIAFVGRPFEVFPVGVTHGR